MSAISVIIAYFNVMDQQKKFAAFILEWVVWVSSHLEVPDMSNWEETSSQTQVVG